MKEQDLQTVYRNQVSAAKKSGEGVKMFLKTFLVLLIVCITFSSFKKDESCKLTNKKGAAFTFTNPNPFYAFALFTYDFTDLSGNDYGDIEIDFHDSDYDYPDLDTEIFVYCYVATSQTGSPVWDKTDYCTTNEYLFATGVPMGTTGHDDLQAFVGTSPNGDYIPDNNL